MFGIFLFKIKILLYEFFENLPYYVSWLSTALLNSTELGKNINNYFFRLVPQRQIMTSSTMLTYINEAACVLYISFLFQPGFKSTLYWILEVNGCQLIWRLCAKSLINGLVGWLCWGLTSQSTIFQSCRDGAIASWVINQYFRGVKCLAQGHNTAAVGLEPRTSRSGVRHSTTEPPRSPALINGDVSWLITWIILFPEWFHLVFCKNNLFSVCVCISCVFCKAGIYSIS